MSRSRERDCIFRSTSSSYFSENSSLFTKSEPWTAETFQLTRFIGSSGVYSRTPFIISGSRTSLARERAFPVTSCEVVKYSRRSMISGYTATVLEAVRSSSIRSDCLSKPKIGRFTISARSTVYTPRRRADRRQVRDAVSRLFSVYIPLI